MKMSARAAAASLLPGAESAFAQPHRRQAAPHPKTTMRPITANTAPWFVNDLLVPTLACSPDPRRVPVTCGFYASFV